MLVVALQLDQDQPDQDQPDQDQPDQDHAGPSASAASTGSGPDERTDGIGAEVASPLGAARSWERAVAALCAGGLALAASGPISDNSLLTHIATARLQVGGGLPRTNPFLVTSSDFPVPSWWWSAGLGWAERFDGLGAVRFTTVVLAAVLGWLVVRCSRPSGAPLAPAPGLLVQLFPAGLVALMLVPWVNARPNLGGMLLLGAALVIWRERHSPLLMAAVFAVWVNVHGSWLYGAAVLGLLWAAECIDARSWSPQRLRWFAGSLGGVVVGGLFYPQRFRLVLLPTEQFGSPQARAAVKLYQEWQRPALSSPWVWVFGLVVLLAGLSALRHRGSRSARIGSVSAVVVLGLAGMSATRLLPVAGLTLAALAADGLAGVSEMGPPPSVLRRSVAALGLIAIAAGATLAWRAPHEDLSRYPVEEVDWLERHDLVANADIGLVHQDWVGNYLDYRFGEEAHAWVDDRPSAQTMVDYVTLLGLDDGWRQVLARADPDVVLWEADEPLTGELDRLPEWRSVLTTERFRVFCRERIAERCR